MNEGQAPVNFFTINGWGYTPDNYNIYSAVEPRPTSNMIQQNINPGVKTQHLDLQLQQEWLKIDKQMTQESKQAFVDWLTDTQYQKMLEFKNAGYSFEASKSLLEQTMGVNGWWYRGEMYQLGQPLWWANSVRNWSNPIGRVFELIDDEVQKIKDFDDWDDEAFSFITALKNVPISLLKTASAIGRWISNPLDTIWALWGLVFTKEWHQILKDRYGSWDALKNTLEKDPVWLISDVATLVTWWASAVAGAGKLWATSAKLAGAANKASSLSRLSTNASKFARQADIVADLWINVWYNKLLDSWLSTLSEGNRASQLVGAWISMTQRPLQTIWKGANPNWESAIFPGIQNKVNDIANSIKDNIQTSATGLTPEVKDRIRNNPYVKEYWDRVEQMIMDEWAPMENQRIMEWWLQEVGEELLRRLNEYEMRLEETWPAYEKLKSLSRPYDLQGTYASTLGVFSKHQITMDAKWQLKFGDMILPTDMNPIQTARSLIQNAQRGQMTARQFLNLRRQLSDLAKFDSWTTARWVKVIRELRAEINKVAKKEIPWLKKADDLYSKQTNELKELRQWLVYQQGERKWQIRDNYHSILKNLGTQNRRMMAQRLETIYPDLSARVEAINMLPKLAKAYQGAPQMMKNLFKTAWIMWGLKYWQGMVQTAVAWLLWIVADELLAKPLGEKWRKIAIDELLNEMSPEAQQKLAEIKSKYDAWVELTEQDKMTLETALQEIMQDEAKYLDEKHSEERQKIKDASENIQPKLPAPELDAINPDGTIRLARWTEANTPDKLIPKNKTEEINNVREELNVDEKTAEKISNSIDNFLEDIGTESRWMEGREVDYNKFKTRSLEELMDSDNIPQTEKEKIAKTLERRWAEEDIKNATTMDQEYAYRINKLMEEEQRIGKVWKTKVWKEYAEKQMRKREKNKEKVIEQIMEDYNIDQQQAIDKYAELEAKPIDYINGYKKSKRFAEEQAERIVLDRIVQERESQPKFIRDMSEDMKTKRNEIMDDMELKDWYEIKTTDNADIYERKVDWRVVDKGAVYYRKNGDIEVIAQNLDWLLESWILDSLPDEAIIKVSWEDMWMTVKEQRDMDTMLWKPDAKTLNERIPRDEIRMTEKEINEKYGSDAMSTKIDDIKKTRFWEWEVQKANIAEIKNMKDVSVIKNNEFKATNTKDLTKQVLDYYNDQYWWMVVRDGINVHLSKKWVKSSIHHNPNNIKSSAFKSVPEIIKHWKETSFKVDRKWNWLNSRVYSAPIQIWENRYVWVVSVNEVPWWDAYFYLHHVIPISKI